jgi:hypothetical protein
MRKVSLLAPASAALLALGLVPARGASSPKIEWVDPSPSPPEASAPLPPQESPPPAAPEAANFINAYSVNVGGTATKSFPTSARSTLRSSITTGSQRPEKPSSRTSTPSFASGRCVRPGCRRARLDRRFPVTMRQQNAKFRESGILTRSAPRAGLALSGSFTTHTESGSQTDRRRSSLRTVRSSRTNRGVVNRGVVALPAETA